MIRCKHCGNQTDERKYDFCEFCCKPISSPSQTQTTSSPSQTTSSPSQQTFDYSVHGTRYVYRLIGCRGRSMLVYPHKCVIKTDVTIGSILTSNATDGEKTIYYKDVIGVQYKGVVATIGYLQLETASAMGNNNSSNFFNENTFTFERNSAEVYEAYKYIISRLDEIKSV